MRRLLVALCACGSSAPPEPLPPVVASVPPDAAPADAAPPPLDLASIDPAQITVRVDPAGPRVSSDLAPSGSFGAFGIDGSCAKTRGVVVDEFVEPLRAFFAAKYPKAKIEAVADGADHHGAFPGTMVWLQPRSDIGAVAIEVSERDHYGAGLYYCVHAVQTGPAIELVLKISGMWTT